MLIIKKKEGGVFSTQKEKETSSFAGLIITTRKPENERLSAPGENERKQKKMVCYITTGAFISSSFSHFWTDGGGLPGDVPGPAMLGYK